MGSTPARPPLEFTPEILFVFAFCAVVGLFSYLGVHAWHFTNRQMIEIDGYVIILALATGSSGGCWARRSRRRLPRSPRCPKTRRSSASLTLPQRSHGTVPTRIVPAATPLRRDRPGLRGFRTGRRMPDHGPGRPPRRHAATFPDGKERTASRGYAIICTTNGRTTLSITFAASCWPYALGRSLLPSRRKTLDAMRIRLTADGYAFGSLVETIVTSPQFLNQR